MSHNIKVRATRRLVFGGASFEVGALLAVSPWDAGALLDSSRAELVSPQDRKLVDQAITKHNADTSKTIEQASLLRGHFMAGSRR